MTIEITEDMIERAQDTDWQSAGSSREAIEKILTAVLNMPVVQAAMRAEPTEDVTEEPPVGARVEDHDGDAWIRSASGWHLENDDGTPFGGMHSWDYVRTWGPLRRLV